MNTQQLTIEVTEAIGTVSAIFLEPGAAKALIVLSHGAGAGMTHPFMEQLAQDLALQGIATLRFQFPYMEKGRKLPSSTKSDYKTIRAALQTARNLNKPYPIYMGGKSYGGRMMSQLAAQKKLADIKGLIYFGFPLHAIGKPKIDRGEHLINIPLPMLFLQGTRDGLADKFLIEAVIESLEDTTLIFFEGADHSFKMLKKTGITQHEVIKKLAQTASNWLDAKSNII